MQNPDASRGPTLANLNFVAGAHFGPYALSLSQFQYPATISWNQIYIGSQFPPYHHTIQLSNMVHS
jgi:hypothetical protein